MEHVIRPAVPNDLDFLVEIFRSCWLISYKGLLPKEVQEEMTAEKARQMWSLSVQPHPDRITFIIEENKVPVGVARVGVDVSNKTLGHLFSLYVHPNSAGRGIGTTLLKYVLSTLRERNFEEITLWVFKENAPTRKLYRTLGFVETGQERIDDRWRIPEIEMRAPSKLF